MAWATNIDFQTTPRQRTSPRIPMHDNLRVQGVVNNNGIMEFNSG